MSIARTVDVPAPRRARLVGEQAFVAGGQVAGGVGNLVFAALMARALAPGEFARLAAFLALYLLVHLPATALTAGSALAPGASARVTRRLALGGVGAGVAVALVTPVLSPLLHLPPSLLLAVAATVPSAGLLALERGRLYATERHGRAVGTLVVEPAVRLTVGVALAGVAGATGAAAGVVLGGYIALAVAIFDRRTRVDRAPVATPDVDRAQVLWAVGLFLLLAVIQNQDVLLANRMLPSLEAARFAVISTIGGAAVFATATIPFVLIPRAPHSAHALGAAVLVAAALGLAALAVVAFAPAELFGAVFGSRYADVAPIAIPYIGAMGLFGVARVFVAQRSAVTRHGRLTFAMLAAVATLQTVLIATNAGTARDVVMATLIATAAMAAATGGAAVARLGRGRTRTGERARGGGVTPKLAILVVIGAAVRLALIERSIWVDEAISIHQATLPFGDMLEALRTADVHPPLHYAALWIVARAFGTGEIVMRAPSVIAGTLLIPMMYLAGRALYDRRTGLLAAACGTVAPFLVWYSQEARMYAFVMLFGVVAIWAQAQALKRGGPVWIIYVLASAAMIWTHYFSVVQVLVQQLFFLVAARRRGNKRFLTTWIASVVALAVLLAPLAPFAYDQYEANQASGRGFENETAQAGGESAPSGEVSIYRAIANFVWALWGYHANDTMAQLAAMWPLGMLLLLYLLGRGRSRSNALLFGVALVPAVVFYAIGFVKQNLFEVRYFAAAVPLLIVLAAMAISDGARSRIALALASTAFIATLAVGLVDQQLNRENPRIFDFEGALARVSTRMDDGDVLLYGPPFIDKVIRYYAPDLKARPVGKGMPKFEEGTRVVVLGSFLEKKQHAANIGAIVGELEYDAKLVDRFGERSQVKVWVFDV